MVAVDCSHAWAFSQEWNIWTAWVHLHRLYSIYRHELNHAQPAGTGYGRIGPPVYVAWRAGTTTLCQSWLYPSSQGQEFGNRYLSVEGKIIPFVSGLLCGFNKHNISGLLSKFFLFRSGACSAVAQRELRCSPLHYRHMQQPATIQENVWSLNVSSSKDSGWNKILKSDRTHRKVVSWRHPRKTFCLKHR